MALTFGGLGIWYLYDLILVATGEFRDGAGLRVVRWDVTDVAGGGDPSIRRVRALEGGVAALRGEGSELAERVEFSGRVLAAGRGEEGPAEGGSGPGEGEGGRPPRPIP